MREKILKYLANFITTRTWYILIAALILTVASGVVTATKLTIHTDQDDLVSESLDYHKRYKDFLREFGDQEYLYVIVETGDNSKRAKDFVRGLVPKLESDPDVKEVLYQVVNPTLEKSFLLYLDKDKLNEIGNLTRSQGASVRDIGSWLSLEDLFRGLNKELDEIVPSKAEDELTIGFEFLSKLITSLKKASGGEKTSPLKLNELFFGEGRAYDEDGFFVSQNGKFLFVMIMPNKDYTTLDVIAKPLERIRGYIAEVKIDFPEIKAGLTGRPVLQADEMQTSNADMMRAGIIALLGVTLLFVITFRRLTRPLLAVFALIIGIINTFGLTTIAIGYLNILSIVFAIILVGVGVDFGIHILARYREEFAKNHDSKNAVFASLTTAGKGNLTGGLTTAVAFYSVCFTKFSALTELGFIAGSGIVICLLSMLIVLPALLYLFDRNKKNVGDKKIGIIKLSCFSFFSKYPKAVLLASFLITLILSPFALKTHFDDNLLNLQAEGLESVNYEKKLIEETEYSTWFCPFIVSSDDEASALVEKLKLSENVGRIEWLNELIPENQVEKIFLIDSIAPGFEDIKYRLATGDVFKENLINELKKLNDHLIKFTDEAFSSGRYDAVEELDKLVEGIDAIVYNLRKGDYGDAVSKLQVEFLGDLKNKLELLGTGMNPVVITKADIPEKLLKRYVSSTERQVVYVYPKYNIWDPEKLEIFVSEMREYDPQVTGTPIEVYESSRLMKDSFVKAAIFAFIAITILLLIDFRSIKDTLLAIMPLAIGIFWLVELMGLFNVPFNLANFFSIPILIGIAVDYGVHLIHRVREGSCDVIATSTGTAILLTSATTALGFGAMMIASHRGIASLGKIMALGSITCLLASIIILPAALKMLQRNC